jgi:phage protein U
MFAMLGDFIFEVLTSPEQFCSASEYTYAEHKVVEAPPLLQWLANDLEKISLELGFHIAFTNPLLQMTLLYTNAQAHLALPFVYGNGVFRGFYVIESIEETHRQLADDGSYIAISAKVELREWVVGADVALATPSRQAAPPPGILTSTSTPTPQPFDANQPISPANLLPASAIVQLSNLGAGPGVTYSPAAYSQPGVSVLVGSGPAGLTPGNPDSVSPATIVRAG